MAESYAKSTTNMLGKILVEEGKYLWGAQEKVEELREELLWMQSFLREAETVQYIDESVGMWVSQIKEHVSEAEDIIDDFVIKVASRRRVNGLANKVKRYSCIARELYDLHQAASSIDSLKLKISTLSPKMEKYGLHRSLGINTEKAQQALTEQVQQSLKYAHIEDKKIVGLDRNAKEIINALKSATPNKGCHALYGMGGLGKTTLATKVSQDDGIKQHFTGGQAFVYISKQFQVQGVLRQVLNKLNYGASENDLVSELHEVLKNNKCLVVLDDIWTQQAWDILKPAFTSCGGNSGSKVLVTTRKEEVAKYVDSMALRKPDPLSKDESWELLQKAMGHEIAQTEMVANKDEKMKLGKEMMKVCNGLPLAIVVLGGILRNKQTLAEWKSVHDNISSYLRMGSDNGRSCMDIILQSYTDLPYHLKPCFLHLAHFPEDYEINTKNLYSMWVGEGLVTRSCTDRHAGRKSLENIANDYLNELALVGLVEIVEKTSEGWIECIRMHDLVRDVCLEKATSEDFLETMDLRRDRNKQQLTTFDYYSSKRLLRLSVYLPDFKGSGRDDGSYTIEALSSKPHKYIRSLLFIVGKGYVEKDELCGKLMASICNEFQMLRVLVFEDLKLRGRLTNKVGKLMHLRYLSLEGTHVSELPSSVGKLRFLESLNLQVSGKLRIPRSLRKLFRLRHFLLPEEGYEVRKSKKLRIHTLIWLETIENLLVENHKTKDLLKIKNLTRLSIMGFVSSEEEMLDIIASLKSSILGSCSKIKVGGGLIRKNPSILSSFVCNHELVIRGRISVPLQQNVEYFSQYLEELSLHDCQLEDDPMRILGSLCNLRCLYFGGGSYVGKKMSSDSNSFPVLTSLQFNRLSNWEVWELEDGSMPKLERVAMRYCIHLNETPHVLPISLKELVVDDIRIHGDRSGQQNVDPYGLTNWLEDAVLKAGEGYEKLVVLLGKCGDSKENLVMKLYDSQHVNARFDRVARTCLPRRSDGRIPRRILQQLLIDLNPDCRDGVANMTSRDLIDKIKLVMQQNKCLVILEEVDLHQDYVQDIMFEIIGDQEGFQSKLVMTTSTSDEVSFEDKSHLLKVFKLRQPTTFETWKMLDNQDWRYCIKWNMLRHCSAHPLSALLLVGLLKTKEDIAKWAANLDKLTGPTPFEFSQIFSLCYNDLPIHLRSCLIFLTNFPEDVEIPIKRLFRMWIAAGFVRSKHDDDEHSENLASTYLTELVQRGMVTLTQREKACQLKFALRDMCLEKAYEEHILSKVDLFEDRTFNELKTQQLAIHLDQISIPTPASFDDQLINSVSISTSSSSSLVFYPNVNYPLYNEEKWDWLVLICNHFQLLRVLDIERMWMTKGSLPKEVGNLRQLRYFSLKGTWVREIPTSIGNLANLETLDLRVLKTVTLPDVFSKLTSLLHLYLPDKFSTQETATKLRLSGMNRLRTLVNLHTRKVRLDDLVDLKLLRKLSIRKVHAADELDDVLELLSTSLVVCFNSEVMKSSSTILSSFRNLHKLKIKGLIKVVELHSQMFPEHLEELTLKHTKLKTDPLPVLETLSELRSLYFDRESFLGNTMTFSGDFQDRAVLTLCSLRNLETLNVSKDHRKKSNKIEIIDCCRLTKKEL